MISPGSLKYILIFLMLVLNFSNLNAQIESSDTIATRDLFDMSLNDLMDVEIISSTQKKQSLFDAPSVVSIVTAEEIKNKGYRTVAQALNHIAGLYVTHDYFQPNLGIRGINGGIRSWSRLVKIMIDGQQVSFRSNSNNFLDESLIPLDAIEKIEIIRGPNSAIYGKNAFLGVINIITYRGKDYNHAKIKQFTGLIHNNPAYGLDATFGGANKNFDFIFSSSLANYDYSGLRPIEVPGADIYSEKDKTIRSDKNPLSLYSKIGYEKDRFGELLFDFSFQKLDSYYEFADWGTLTHNNRVSLINSYQRIQYNNILFNALETNISLAHSNGMPADEEILDNDQNAAYHIQRELDYHGFDASMNFAYALDDHNNISLGADFTTDYHNHQRYYLANAAGDKTVNPGGTKGKNNFDNLGIYLQIILNPGILLQSKNFLSDFNFTAGYRYDYHNIYEDVFNYRLGLVYNIAEGYSTKIIYGTSFNAPSSVQLYSNFITPGGIVGNPDLEPEKAKTMEWAFLSKISKEIFINTNLFYTEIEDKIEYLLPYGDVSNIRAENISNIYSGGIEAEIKLNIRNTYGYIQYSYQRSLLEKENLRLGMLRLNTSLYPSHLIKFGETIHLKKPALTINLEGQYVSSRIASDQNNFIYDPVDYAINRYELNPYFIINLNIGTTQLELINGKETLLNIRVENLLNTDYAYPGFKNYDIPGFERSIMMKITQNL